MPAWHHLTFASEGRNPLFPGDAVRLAAVHALARVAGDRLALFFVADDHVHLVAHVADRKVGRLAHDQLLAPADDAALRRLGPARLAAAAARAGGVVLEGRSGPVVAARAATAHLAVAAGLSLSQSAEVLGITPRALRYLGTRPASEPLLLAVRRRVALDGRVAAHPVAGRPPRDESG